MASAPGFADVLAAAIAADDRDLVIDFAGLTFVDSSGVRVLVNARAKLQTENRTLRIENIRPGQRRVFEILGLLELFTGEDG